MTSRIKEKKTSFFNEHRFFIADYDCKDAGSRQRVGLECKNINRALWHLDVTAY